MDAALAGHGYAKSAVDIAAFDLFGKLCGVPTADLLGGRQVANVPLYVAVPLGAPAEMVGFVLAERARGTHRFQLKVGADAESDVARVRAVVEATGEGDTIVADANGGWRLPEAVQAVGMLDGTPRLRIEQPCRSLEECLQVRRRTSLPMVLDEVITDMQALLRATGERAAEGINLKISRVGGLAPARAMRDVCVELGLSLLIEDTWGGDLCSAAVAALAGSTPASALWAASFMNDWTLEHVAGYQPRSAGGWGPSPRPPAWASRSMRNALGSFCSRRTPTCDPGPLHPSWASAAPSGGRRSSRPSRPPGPTMAPEPTIMGSGYGRRPSVVAATCRDARARPERTDREELP